MRLKKLKLWAGFFGVLASSTLPLGAFATGDASLRGALVLTGTGFLTAMAAWLNQWLSEAMKEDAEAKAKKRRASSRRPSQIANSEDSASDDVTEKDL